METKEQASKIAASLAARGDAMEWQPLDEIGITYKRSDSRYGGHWRDANGKRIDTGAVALLAGVSADLIARWEDQADDDWERITDDLYDDDV
jgi:hypothetical protein